MAFARSALLLAMLLLAIESPKADENFTNTAVVVDKVVYPGQVIDAATVRIVKLRDSIPRNSEFAVEVSDIVGKAATSTLLPNRLVRLASLSVPAVVKAGDKIEVIYKAPGVTIYMDGISLNDGSVGDFIAVRNNATGAQVQAAVVDGKTVRITAR